MNEALAILVAYNLRVLAREVRMRRLEVDLESEVLVFEHCIREVVEMRRLSAWAKAMRAGAQAIRCAGFVLIRFNSSSLCEAGLDRDKSPGPNRAQFATGAYSCLSSVPVSSEYLSGHSIIGLKTYDSEAVLNSDNRSDSVAAPS